jgi:hypothetical protein
MVQISQQLYYHYTESHLIVALEYISLKGGFTQKFSFIQQDDPIQTNKMMFVTLTQEPPKSCTGQVTPAVSFGMEPPARENEHGASPLHSFSLHFQLVHQTGVRVACLVPSLGCWYAWVSGIILFTGRRRLFRLWFIFKVNPSFK